MANKIVIKRKEPLHDARSVLYHSPHHQRLGSFIAFINRQSKIEEATCQSEEKEKGEQRKKRR
jgi:hypothetical protein